MSRLPFRAVLLTLGVLGLALPSPPIRADEANPRIGKKTDWATIDGLLAAGDYAEVVAAATNEITKADRPKRWDADFLPRSVEWSRLLMRRGVAELHLGRLAAAEESLEEAYRLLTDDDFKRQLAKESKSGNVRTISTLALIDVDLVELIYLRMAVLLERFRYANLGIEAAPAGQAGALPELVERWRDELDGLERLATRARKDLAERLERADPAMLTSPYYQSLLGRYRSALAAAIWSLEQDKLEAAGTGSAAESGRAAAASASGAKAVESRKLVSEAAAALDEACKAAAPQGIDSMKRDARIEALLMQAELLECEGRVLVQLGEVATARERFAKVLEVRQEVAAVRRIKQPEKHSDLLVPLLLSAETLLDEAQVALDANDAARSRDRSLEASKVLERVNGLSFPTDHPLRAWQKGLVSRVTSGLAAVKAAIPGNDVADAAARRIQRAIDGTAMAGASTAP